MKKTLLAMACSILAVASVQAAEDGLAVSSGQSLAPQAALATWGKIYEVFSHPRCANCHVPEDNRPRWSGAHYGEDAQYHGMYINGGVSRSGAESIVCTTCHQKENSEVLHGPPGAEVWALAPLEMVWWEKSSAEICAQIKDPSRNGQRSLQAVADHIDHDALVHWGWNPGLGREPAPYSAKEVVKFINDWAASGAPCPE